MGGFSRDRMSASRRLNDKSVNSGAAVEAGFSIKKPRNPASSPACEWLRQRPAPDRHDRHSAPLHRTESARRRRAGISENDDRIDQANQCRTQLRLQSSPQTGPILQGQHLKHHSDILLNIDAGARRRRQRQHRLSDQAAKNALQQLSRPIHRCRLRCGTSTNQIAQGEG